IARSGQRRVRAAPRRDPQRGDAARSTSPPKEGKAPTSPNPDDQFSATWRRAYRPPMNTGSDDQIVAWLEEQDRMITQIVRQNGWAVQYVNGEGTTPPFAYTVGLFGLNHPELIVFGLDYSSAIGLLNYMGTKVREGDDLLHGDVVLWEGTDTRVRIEVLPN